ncbi:MAG TPA: Hpt domain-containing protein [Bryobacteraceae bacterium]|nr:Hpt domain-containing protein [Bryobacteraceae bacterium]
MTTETQSSELEQGVDPYAVWVLPDALRQLVQSGDTEILGELIAIFRSDTASRMEALHRALADGDLAVVRAQAHAIKGSAIQVGANGMGQLCKEIELEGTKKSRAELAGMLSRLQECFEQVSVAMAAHGDANL